MKYIERDFPIERLNEIAMKEGNAKKPIYQLHKWWARRLGSVFRMLILARIMMITRAQKKTKKSCGNVSMRKTNS